jgi:putative ABC transport system permease protein
MKFKEIILISLSSLKANKLRSGLTMLGVIIGVFSILGVMTVIGVLQNSIESGLSFLGSNVFQIQKDPPIVGAQNHNRLYANRKNISYEQAVEIKQLLQDKAGAIGFKVSESGVSASYDNLKTDPNITIIGSDENFLTIQGFDVDDGRNLTEGDVNYARSVALIGNDVRLSLFPNSNPLGQIFRAGGQNYTIVGILAIKGSSFGQSQDNLIIVPISRFFETYGKANRSLRISIQTTSQKTYQETVDAAIGVTRLVRGLDAGQENDFGIFSNDSLIEQFNAISGTIRIGALIISAISLLAAGIGIMNIMLVSVTERTKEIGIRKAIGAKKISVLIQFLIEAVVLCELGGIIGIVLGVGGGNLLAFSLNTSVSIPYFWAGFGLVSCSIIGIGFGLYPAYKAANLDPIEALRFE